MMVTEAVSVHSTPAVRPRPTRRAAGAVGAVLAVATLALTACGTTSSGSSGSSAASTPAATGTGSLLAAATTSLGTILVDGHGMAVYRFAADSPGHSTCTGTCLQYWPIVPAPATLPASLTGVGAPLGVLTRSDGTKQLTVAGWPVYTYAADTTAGVATGQGKNLSGGLWWVLSASGTPVTTTSGTAGTPSPSASPSASTSSSSAGGWA
jgi:predicted lipoprotein with Yx(FWY)xxD motif